MPFETGAPRKMAAAVRHPHRLVRLEDPMLSGDAAAISIRLVTQTAPPFDLTVPVAEIGDVIQFVASATDHLAARAEADGVDLSARPSEFPPIRVRRIDFAAGPTPEDTLLVVRAGCFDLVFALDTT